MAALPEQIISDVMIGTALAIIPRSGGPMLTPLKRREEPGLRGCPLRYEILVAFRCPFARHSPNRAEPPLHVHRGGIAHLPRRHARRAAHAGRYFSEHQHADHLRGLAIPGLA